ncbi:MAG: hypothetical protein R3F02_16710 [Thiolinea sp.]
MMIKAKSVLFLTLMMLFCESQADCQYVYSQLYDWVKNNKNTDDEFPPGISVVYSFNKLRPGNTAHGGIHTGWIDDFKPDGTLESTTLGYTINYDSPQIQKVAPGIFSFHRNGRMELTLPRWNNVVLPVHYAQCYQDRFGYYVSGMRREGNGTSMVGITFRKIDP